MQLFGVLILLSNCSKKSKVKPELIPLEVQSKALEFHSSSFNSGVTIGLNTDSSFYIKSYLVSCVGGGIESATTGKYSKIENKIKLSPNKVISRRFYREDIPDLITESPYDTTKNKFWLKVFHLANIDSNLFLLSISKFDHVIFPKSPSPRILPKDANKKEAYINRVKTSGKEHEVRSLGIRYFALNRKPQQPLEDYLMDKEFQNFDFPLSNYSEDIRQVVRTDLLWKKTKFYYN